LLKGVGNPFCPLLGLLSDCLAQCKSSLSSFPLGSKAVVLLTPPAHPPLPPTPSHSFLSLLVLINRMSFTYRGLNLNLKEEPNVLHLDRAFYFQARKGILPSLFCSANSYFYGSNRPHGRSASPRRSTPLALVPLHQRHPCPPRAATALSAMASTCSPEQ